MPKKQQHYKTIVLSDIHLGSKWSKTKEVTHFLKQHSCDTLILCGDIIDGWSLMRGKNSKWRRRHTNFIKVLLDISHDTKIIYVRGNHDDFLDRVIPLTFSNISVVKDYIYTSGDKRYYVLHGDVFDKVTSSMSWLAKVGDVGYSFLLWANKIYNRRRLKKGLPYYSIVREIKLKVKASVSYISDFEKHIVDPEKKMIGNVLYLNSGDWMESLSALTEDYDGNWNVYIEEKALTEVRDSESETVLHTGLAV